MALALIAGIPAAGVTLYATMLLGRAVYDGAAQLTSSASSSSASGLSVASVSSVAATAFLLDRVLPTHTLPSVTPDVGVNFTSFLQRTAPTTARIYLIYVGAVTVGGLVHGGLSRSTKQVGEEESAPVARVPE
jgi:hypothetical protein